MAKKVIKPAPPKETAETWLINLVFNTELSTAIQNKSIEDSDFERNIDMLECNRTEKNYDWQSNITIPEYWSHFVTQSSTEASQYFNSRDFVECFIYDGSEDAIKNADAAQECINRTLGQKHLHFYQKFMRGTSIKNLNNSVYLRCWWEKAYKTTTDTIMDVEYIRLEDGTAMPRIVNREVENTTTTRDRFNFDVLDPRNVFTSSEYSYSLQDKEFVILRFERTLQQLKSDAEEMGYFNLDKLAEIKPPSETETSKQSYNKDENKIKSQNMVMPFDIYERYGKAWAIVKESRDGYPIKIELGIDDTGKEMDNAKFIECIMTFANSGSSNTLIRFQPQPYKDPYGEPYRPLIRGLCYIHPSKDSGLGDGKPVRELQVAIDDTINLSNDRVMFATMPTFKVKKYAVENNASLYFEPGHGMEVEDTNDITEFVASDNINGALNQLAILTGGMDKAMSIFPNTMGQLPGIASTTATAIAGADSRSNIRANYKSLTFENTCLVPFYYMILCMTSQFAEPETGIKLMGDKVEFFDATKEYFYTPLSQAIETEYSKQAKIKELNTMLGYVIPSVQLDPNMLEVSKYIIGKLFTLMGDEHGDIVAKLVTPNIANGGQKQIAVNEMAMSNQNGMPQSNMEEMVRSVA